MPPLSGIDWHGCRGILHCFRDTYVRRLDLVTYGRTEVFLETYLGMSHPLPALQFLNIEVQDEQSESDIAQLQSHFEPLYAAEFIALRVIKDTGDCEAFE